MQLNILGDRWRNCNSVCLACIQHTVLLVSSSINVCLIPLWTESWWPSSWSLSVGRGPCLVWSCKGATRIYDSSPVSSVLTERSFTTTDCICHQHVYGSKNRISHSFNPCTPLHKWPSGVDIGTLERRGGPTMTDFEMSQHSWCRGHCWGAVWEGVKPQASESCTQVVW